MNIPNSCAGLPNPAAVFVFGILKGLGLLRAWEGTWVSRAGMQLFQCLESHFCSCLGTLTS